MLFHIIDPLCVCILMIVIRFWLLMCSYRAYTVAVQKYIWQGLLGSVIANVFVAHWKRNSGFAFEFCNSLSGVLFKCKYETD